MYNIFKILFLWCFINYPFPLTLFIFAIYYDQAVGFIFLLF